MDTILLPSKITYKRFTKDLPPPKSSFDQIHQLESIAFPAFPKLANYRKQLASSIASSLNIAFTDTNTVAAYCFVATSAGQAHITSLVTHPDFRRQGHAKRLLVMGVASSKCSCASLIVASTNSKAKNLYQSLGFAVSDPPSLLESYYPDNSSALKYNLDDVSDIMSLHKTNKVNEGKALGLAIALQRVQSGEKKTQRQMNVSNGQGGDEEDDRSRHGAANKNRSKIFIDFVVAKFALSSNKNNNKKGVILDVAGGKGENTLRLVVCHQLRAVLIDPREADFYATFTKMLVPRLPGNWRRRINNEATGGSRGCLDRLVSANMISQRNVTFDEELDPAILEILDSGEVELLIGLHSDNATEAIVRTALARGLSFAVVPCCVFPSFFKQRTIIDSTTGKAVKVRTVLQFVEFLVGLGEGIQVERLGFNGANMCVYRKI